MNSGRDAHIILIEGEKLGRGAIFRLGHGFCE
jgi:hypothetical protein